MSETKLQDGFVNGALQKKLNLFMPVKINKKELDMIVKLS